MAEMDARAVFADGARTNTQAIVLEVAPFAVELR
jgi:hypothetical protein